MFTPIYNLIGTGVNAANIAMKQVPSAGGASYLLDTYPAFAAYSTLQLSSTATNCLRVRRASDNAEADIGFADGWLDESAVATHCGASNGFVVTMYDQSGNGYDATQATSGNQPQIYDGSAVLKQNGKPRLESASGCFLSLTASASQAITIFSVTDTNMSANYRKWANAAADFYFTPYVTLLDARIYAGLSLQSSGDVMSLGQSVITALYNGSSSVLRQNSTELKSGDCGSNGFTDLQIFGAASQTAEASQSVIVYNSDQTANFSAIETDITGGFAFPASDSFSGTGTDSGSTTDQNFTDRFAQDNSDGTSAISGGSLAMTSPSSATLKVEDWRSLQATYGSGDFTITLDYSSLVLSGAGAEGATLHCYINGVLYYIQRTYNGGHKVAWSGGTSAVGSGDLLSGTFKLERIGTNLKGYIDDTEYFSATVSNNLTTVWFNVSTNNGSTGCSVNYDAFAMADGSGDPININF